jgi:carboxymethylenebutenolidase
MSQMIEFKRPDGQTAQGWLVEPAQPRAPRPGADPGMVGPERSDQGRGRGYARAGYRVLVPDLYRGRSTVEAEEAEHLMNALDFADAASQDIRGAVLHLQASGSAKLGVTGYCMGGALTLLSACFSPELAAAVAWYGFPPLSTSTPRRSAPR